MPTPTPMRREGEDFLPGVLFLAQDHRGEPLMPERGDARLVARL